MAGEERLMTGAKIGLSCVAMGSADKAWSKYDQNQQKPMASFPCACAPGKPSDSPVSALPAPGWSGATPAPSVQKPAILVWAASCCVPPPSLLAPPLSQHYLLTLPLSRSRQMQPPPPVFAFALNGRRLPS